MSVHVLYVCGLCVGSSIYSVLLLLLAVCRGGGVVTSDVECDC